MDRTKKGLKSGKGPRAEHQFWWMEDLGIAAVVVEPAWNMGIEPRACSFFQVLIRMCPANAQLNTFGLDNGRGGMVEQWRLAVDSVTNSVLMDTLPVLCPDPECSSRRNGNWWWRDEAHISITASRALAPLIAKKMLEAQQLMK